jgi:hypothetical protein
MGLGTAFLLQCAEIESSDIVWVSNVLSAVRFDRFRSAPVSIRDMAPAELTDIVPMSDIDALVLMILVRDDEELQNMVIALATATQADPFTIRRVLQDHLGIMDHVERDRLYAHARLRLSTANTPGMGRK